MKNLIKFLGIIAFVAVIGLAFTACGGDDGGKDERGNGGDTNLVGKWYVTQDNANSGTASAMIYNFESNGGLTIVSQSGYTWSASGGKITLYYSGRKTDTANYSISGTALTISNMGYSGLTDGTYYKPSSGNGNGNGGGNTTHPIVGTKWEGTNSQPYPYNMERIMFYTDGSGQHLYTSNKQTVSNTFTYTVSGNTITLSKSIRNVSTFTYSGGNTLTLAGITYTMFF